MYCIPGGWLGKHIWTQENPEELFEELEDMVQAAFNSLLHDGMEIVSWVMISHLK